MEYKQEIGEFRRRGRRRRMSKGYTVPRGGIML